MKYCVSIHHIDTDSEFYGAKSKFFARLHQANIPFIPGFIITNEAYNDFLRKNKLEIKIRQLLSTIAIDRPDSLMQGEYHIKNLFKNSFLPENIVETIIQMNTELSTDVQLELVETGKLEKKHKMITAVESKNVVEQLIPLWSEMFSGAALWRRHQLQSDLFASGAEIIVTAALKGEKTGAITTIDPETHEKNTLVISTRYPHERDRYFLSKKNLTIIDRQLTHSPIVRKLSTAEIDVLGETAKKIEELLYFPQEISWLFANQKLWITDIKPVSSIKRIKTMRPSKLPAAHGIGVTTRISTGKVHIVNLLTKNKISTHDIIIVSQLPAEKVSNFKHTRGIIIESPILNSATISLLKQYAIPSVSNVKNATRLFHNGTIVTIHSAKGEIYDGGFL